MLALKPFEKIAKKKGLRISKKALEELRDIIDEEAEEIAIEAIRLCEHAKRRTVMRRDVDLASQR